MPLSVPFSMPALPNLNEGLELATHIAHPEVMAVLSDAGASVSASIVASLPGHTYSSTRASFATSWIVALTPAQGFLTASLSLMLINAESAR
ncbi:hypothetical protein BDW75DRAFT_236137 [Aspergillus navahoensis]